MKTEIIYFDKKETAPAKELRGVGGVPKKEFWQMTLDEYLLVAPKELLVASAGSYAKIKELIEEYYFGKKELVDLSTELMYRYKVQGNRNGKDYFHKADRVFYNEKKRTFYFEQVKSHEDIIKKAISENKQIPAEVLAEYSDLMPKKEKEVWEMTFEEYCRNNEKCPSFNSAERGIYHRTWLRKSFDFDSFKIPAYRFHEQFRAISNKKMSFKRLKAILAADNIDKNEIGYYAKYLLDLGYTVPVEVIEEYPKLLKLQATNLLQQYKNDSNSLQGTPTPQGLKALAGLQNISFTAYITAANPRQDKQGRGKLLVQAQKERVKALEISNIALLQKSELLFEDLKNFNFEALLDFIGKYPQVKITHQDSELIGYWAGEPEPSMQLDFLATTKNDFWQTIKSLTDFAVTHSQDAFIVSVPLTKTERAAIEKDEILINTQTADGFWYSPVFNLPFADLSTKEQLSIEAEFYKTFGEVGFSMYIYKSKINNRTVNYKLIFSHEIAKNIGEFLQIIEETVARVTANEIFRVSKSYGQNVEQLIKIFEKGKRAVDFEKVMFFSADNFEGDSRSYSKVLAEIGKRMRGLGGVAGLGAKSVELFDGLMTYTPNSKGLGRSEAEIEQQAKKQNLGLLLAVEFALFSVMKQLDVSFENIRQYLSKGTISKDFSEIDKVFNMSDI